jgi:hypothetical protein
MNNVEQSFQRWLENGEITVFVEAEDLTQMQQQLKQLLIEACNDLETREIIPPEEGHVVASPDFVAWVCQKLEIEVGNPQLQSALGGATRLFMSYQDLVMASGQQISQLHKFNLDDCCLRGFFIRVQDLAKRVTALEKKVNTEFQKVNTEFQKVNTEFQKVNTEFQKVHSRIDGVDKKLDEVLRRLSPAGSEAHQRRGAPHERDEVSGSEGEDNLNSSHISFGSASTSPPLEVASGVPSGVQPHVSGSIVRAAPLSDSPPSESPSADRSSGARAIPGVSSAGHSYGRTAPSSLPRPSPR